MTEYHGKLKEAQHILIVGGGGVGVEMAGDLAEAYPVSTGKTISLVHRRPKLLNDALCDKFRDGLANRLRDMGVHLYLNDQLDELDNETLQDASSHTWTTREGHRLENVDFVIRATQCKFNTGLLANLVPHLLSKNGVIVKSTFQLEGFENVFVMGDLADLPEQRSAMKHRGHASTVIANILALEGKGEFTDYRPTIEAMLVSLGTNGGMLTVVSVAKSSIMTSSDGHSLIFLQERPLVWTLHIWRLARARQSKRRVRQQAEKVLRRQMTASVMLRHRLRPNS